MEFRNTTGMLFELQGLSLKMNIWMYGLPNPKMSLFCYSFVNAVMQIQILK